MEIERLTMENSDLLERNQALDVELRNIKSIQEGGPDDEATEQPEQLSEEAQRKRLERLCKRKTDGNPSQLF